MDGQCSLLKFLDQNRNLPDRNDQSDDTSSNEKIKLRKQLLKSVNNHFVHPGRTSVCGYCMMVIVCIVHIYCLEANKTNSNTVGCKNFHILDVHKHAKSKDHRYVTEVHAMKLLGAIVPVAFYRMLCEHEEAVVV